MLICIRCNSIFHLYDSCRPKFVNFAIKEHVQYDARDKFLSGVVGGPTASESVAIAASVSGESGAKVKRIATDSREKL